MDLDDYQAEELALYYEDKRAEDLLDWAIKSFHPKIVIASSFQAEDMVIIDMAVKINKDVRIFTIDTGRLHEETYQFIDFVRDYYGINIEVIFPQEKEVEKMVSKHGMNLFYKSVDLRMLCCHIRKVRPLRNFLNNVEAWVTGLRREQWASRVNIKKIELDHEHGGIVKINPLADWTHEDVWNYIKEKKVPYHPLYDKGFKSIGCAPCTRAVKEGEDPRAGRWWWEREAPKECGIHCSCLLYTSDAADE